MEELSPKAIEHRDPKSAADRVAVRVVVITAEKQEKGGNNVKKGANTIAKVSRVDYDAALARGNEWLAKAKLTDAEEAEALQEYEMLKSNSPTAAAKACPVPAPAIPVAETPTVAAGERSDNNAKKRKV